MRSELRFEIDRMQRVFAAHGEAFQPRAGVTEERLAWLEKELGYKLDEDVRDFYRFSDGAKYGNSWFVIGQEWPQSLDFLCVDESAKNWFSLPLDEKRDQALYAQLEQNFFDCEDDERDKRIKPRTWMHRRWWPLGGGSSSHSVMFDADPAPGGTYGQIIAFYHDPDEIVLIADSFIEFLRKSNSWHETRWSDAHGGGDDDEPGAEDE